VSIKMAANSCRYFVTAESVRVLSAKNPLYAVSWAFTLSNSAMYNL